MRPSLKQIDKAIWELPKSFKPGMRVPGRIFGTKKIVEALDEGVFEQTANVATLPGIVNYSIALPDAHWGYGFPIGGVAAFDVEKGGVISPGGVGFDINCGMRLLSTNLKVGDVTPSLDKLVKTLFDLVPAGLGRRGFLKITKKELNEIMIKGSGWMIDNGLGWQEDRECIEDKGSIAGANPDKVSQRAVERGISQLATLGSGNHYLEIQKVEKIFQPEIAKEMKVYKPGQIVVMFHCGSRGFGHQICSDYLKVFGQAMGKYKIGVPDRQLACAPFSSKEGQNYFAAMAAAANFAFANRQAITFKIRQAFMKVFEKKASDLKMYLVYDVVHNMAKLEKFHPEPRRVRGALNRNEVSRSGQILKQLLIHRKGATRSYPGQPVIIGGSMETGSYLLSGTEKSLDLTFGSTAHGSGRTMSRTKAKKQIRGKSLWEKMKKEGILVKSASMAGLAEEAGFAYKDISEVVKSVELAGISKAVASFKPIGNIKG